uniref:Uncharacterized protein n=1 Tax=Anguilla anguilla TaxID=7936 RepID=A0A0E9SLV6_ANGAN
MVVFYKKNLNHIFKLEFYTDDCTRSFQNPKIIIAILVLHVCTAWLQVL